MLGPRPAILRPITKPKINPPASHRDRLCFDSFIGRISGDLACDQLARLVASYRFVSKAASGSAQRRCVTFPRPAPQALTAAPAFRFAAARERIAAPYGAELG